MRSTNALRQNDLHFFRWAQQLVGAALEDQIESVDGALQVHPHGLYAKAVDSGLAQLAEDIDPGRLAGPDTPQQVEPGSFDRAIPVMEDPK